MKLKPAVAGRVSRTATNAFETTPTSSHKERLHYRTKRSERPAFKDLTPVQQALIKEIRGSWYRRGFPPTMRELAVSVGLASPSSVHRAIGELERLGWVSRRPGLNRTLRVAA